MRRALIVWVASFAALFLPSSAYAQFCNDDPAQGVETALGCLQAQNPYMLIGQIVGWSVGIGGGIAFLMIVFASLQIATASGDPKKVKSAQELLTSAIAGLLLIIFSIALLRLVGVNILGLGGLGFPTI